jgi:hypothetical protein
MNALALARLDDPLAGSKPALRRSETLCTLASGLTSLQPSNDVGEKSSSYDEHASGSLFWTQKDPIRFGGGQENIYVYASDDPINGSDANGLDGDPCSQNKPPYDPLCPYGGCPPGPPSPARKKCQADCFLQASQEEADCVAHGNDPQQCQDKAVGSYNSCVSSTCPP